MCPFCVCVRVLVHLGQCDENSKQATQRKQIFTTSWTHGDLSLQSSSPRVLCCFIKIIHCNDRYLVNPTHAVPPLQPIQWTVLVVVEARASHATRQILLPVIRLRTGLNVSGTDPLSPLCRALRPPAHPDSSRHHTHRRDGGSDVVFTALS